MGNISVDYDVLNQKGSPAWYSDTFANIPTPGYKGRMFISIDTFAFYRDNGVGWDLVGGPGTGTITGAGVSGQVTYFIGTDTIGGNNNLFYDITNSRLGIGTATPGAPLDIHSTGTAAQFNGTGVNNAFVFFQNAGTSKWRIGNLYNSGANDYQIYDVLNATARLTIKNTGDSTLIGTFTATSLIKSGGTNLQILLADGSTTPTSTFGAGSVTSVSAITLGTSGTDLSSSVANSTTTPVITLNVPTASATNRGALSSADWTTFNSKQATITLTTTGTSGAATLVGATLNIPNYTNVGTVTSVAALTLGTSGTDLSSTVANSTSTPVITLNVPTASATNRGALSSADFTTFNNKQTTISVTAPVVLTGATISMPAATTSVNGYLTSTDWNTFNNKSNTNGTVTSVVALTIGTTGIDITSTAVTTTTTPVITLNIPTASASNRGALSSTDWTTFNNKQATLSLTTTGTSGAATLVANTLNVPNYGSALSGYLPLTGGTLTGPLGGTSASFSSTGFFGSDVFTYNGGGIFFSGSASYTSGILQNVNGLILQSGGTARLTIASNGASTFTNGIATLGYTASSSYAGLFNGKVGIGSSSTPVYNLEVSSDGGSQRIRVGTLQNNDNTPKFEAITSNGTTVANSAWLKVNDASGFTIGQSSYTKTGGDSGNFANLSAEVESASIIVNGSGAATFSNTLNVSTTAGVYSIIQRGITPSGSQGIILTAGYGNTENGSGITFADNSNSGGTILLVGNSSDIYGGGVALIAYGQTASANIITFATRSGVGTTAERMRITSEGVVNVVSRGNFLNATDNALFSLNSGGTLYTVGFSPTATASSTNTLTLTTGTTTWIYTGTGTATWTLPNPSGNNQIYWIKNAGTGIITLNAYSGTNIINNAAASVSSVTIAVGATAVIAQDGNVKSYQLQ